MASTAKKQFELKNGTIKVNDRLTVNYAHTIKGLINSPKEGGFTISEIKERVELLGAVESAEDKEAIALSADQAKTLVALIPEKWAVFSTDIPAFEAALRSLEAKLK